MGWKTIIVKNTDRIFLKNNQLAFASENNIQTFPIHDINCIILENNYTYITCQLLRELAKNHVFVLVCDQKHDPVGLYISFNTHWAPVAVLNMQMEMGVHYKKQIWTKLIRQKIINSELILEKLKFAEEERNALQKLWKNISYNDVTNHEGVAAKYFFRCLYGSNFIRHTDTGINRALNYGYKILLSAINRSISKYGLNNHLGVWHKGKTNPFNLSCDLIEPFRPFVDYFVSQMGEEIHEELVYNQRLKLVKILQLRVNFENEIRTVNNTIDLMVKSFLSSLKTNNSDKLKLPRFIIESIKEETIE